MLALGARVNAKDDTPPSSRPGASVGGAPSIARTALLLLPVQVFFRGGEAALPLLLAAWFGRNAETDVYYLLASYFVFGAALLTGAFQDSAVIPVIIQVEHEDPASLPAVAGSLLGHTIAIGAAAALVTGAIAAAIAAFTSTEPALALLLTGAMAVGLVSTAVRAFYMGLLNARGRFRAHPLASGAGIALSFLVIAAGKGALGVLVIPLAMLAGDLLAIAALAAFCKLSLEFWVRPTLARPEAVRRIFKLVKFEVAGQLITRINPFIDQLMAGLAGVIGGGTLLRYANDVSSLPTSILQATLFPVFLTRIAHEVNAPERFASTMRRTLAAVVGLLLVLAALFAAVRGPLARLLFLHGSMDEAGAAGIAAILPWGLVGVAPFGALLVLARAHVALQNSRIMPSMGLLNSALNAILNLLFVRLFGLPGIALSTSVTYLVVAVVFWVRLPRHVRA
jgi:putative peptidoglycan lipid II flippase